MSLWLSNTWVRLPWKILLKFIKLSYVSCLETHVQTQFLFTGTHLLCILYPTYHVFSVTSCNLVLLPNSRSLRSLHVGFLASSERSSRRRQLVLPQQVFIASLYSFGRLKPFVFRKLYHFMRYRPVQGMAGCSGGCGSWVIWDSLYFFLSTDVPDQIGMSVPVVEPVKARRKSGANSNHSDNVQPSYLCRIINRSLLFKNFQQCSAMFSNVRQGLITWTVSAMFSNVNPCLITFNNVAQCSVQFTNVRQCSVMLSSAQQL